MPQTIKQTSEIIKQAQTELEQTQWKIFDEIKDFNQEKVLNAFIEAGIQNSHYAWVTGYGYDDLGKDKLDEIFARTFKTEAAIVRPKLVSGTHAISCAVFGNLNAGDSFVAIGKPYDTLGTVFKKNTEKFGLNYSELSELNPVSLESFDDSALELVLRNHIT